MGRWETGKTGGRLSQAPLQSTGAQESRPGRASSRSLSPAVPSCTCLAPAAAPRKGPTARAETRRAAGMCRGTPAHGSPSGLSHWGSGARLGWMPPADKSHFLRVRLSLFLSRGQQCTAAAPRGPAERGGAPHRRGGSGTQRSRADGGLRGPLGPPWTFCASWSLLSAGPGFWARAGEPDFSGARRHHRPSEGWREGGCAFALPVGRVGEDDHGRRAGDRLRHRSVGRAGACPVGAQ